MGDSVPKHTGPNSLTDTYPRTERLQNPTDHHRRITGDEKARWSESSSCLPIQLLGVEIHSSSTRPMAEAITTAARAV